MAKTESRVDLWLAREGHEFVIFDVEPGWDKEEGWFDMFDGVPLLDQLCLEMMVKVFPEEWLPKEGEFVKLNVSIDGTYYTYEKPEEESDGRDSG